jgi:hypothetical protein
MKSIIFFSESYLGFAREKFTRRCHVVNFSEGNLTCRRLVFPASYELRGPALRHSLYCHVTYQYRILLQCVLKVAVHLGYDA